MQKQGRCLNCDQPFKIPTQECFASCSNCHQLIIYFCHIQQSNPKDLLRMQCGFCNSLHSLLTCPACRGSMVIRNFLCGNAYSCPCGFKGTFIVCNKCIAVLALPTGKNYQKSDILCKNPQCHHVFRYKNCQKCMAMIYQQQGDKTDIYICPNDKCQNSKIPYYPNQQMQDATRIAQQQNKGTAITQIIEKDMCKICLDQEAQMINITCFHLSVCSNCSKSMKNQCPICRAEGEYKRVFKS